MFENLQCLDLGKGRSGQPKYERLKGFIIGEMLAGLEEWMEKHSFETLADFRGRLSYSNVENPAAYERIQFMKQFAGIS